MRTIVTLTAALLMLCAVALYAGVPNAVQYQGRLTSDVGVPLTGTYTLTFSIYTSETGGVVKWTETQTGVVADQGLFSVILGSIVPLPDSVFNQPDRYLEVQVNGEPLLPRTRLTSSSYSNRVATIDGASGGVITDSIMIIPSQQGMAGRTPNGPQTTSTAIVIGLNKIGAPSMSFYEPVDAKAGVQDTDPKKMEIQGSSIVMYAANGIDTTLIVFPNGDITSKGQITMGENSSPGVKTTVLGFKNTAVGDSSTIGGGSNNITHGVSSVIAGGHGNQADGEGSVVSGGSSNHAIGKYSTVSGGKSNQAAGDYGSVPGGQSNNADGQYAYAAGRRSKANHDGAFVWADHTDADFSSTANDQFLIRAKGGVGIGTNTPHGVVDIVGPDQDTSVNLPGNAVSAPEILDEPGVAGEWNVEDVVLIQGMTNMQPLVTVTLNLPAPGYVVLHGSATLEFTGTSQRNQAYVQISEAPGGGTIGPFSRSVGTGDNPSQNRTTYFNMAVERVFFMTAGEHSFVLEGQAHPLNGGSAISKVQHPQISAIYYPSSYGEVVGFVSAQQAPGFQTAQEADWTETNDSLNTISLQTYYKVDLRELEKKVQQARRLYDQAEADLKAAQLLQSSGR